ncbi:addiction module protein [Humibacter sp.]|uniref:addiction module protein n=1 Tax=Humibacter sp. TaxID=1940291 RepID=UPI003F810DCD
MAPDIAEVLTSAKSLAREQIADLAYELLRVLDEDQAPVDQATVDAAWSAELRRRVDDVESGAVEVVSHQETVAEARAFIASRRKCLPVPNRVLRQW